MPKELIAESRFDFRGGLNVYVSPDLLNENELVLAENTRVDTDGALTKRTGSRRMHAAALAAAPIMGVYQWEHATDQQIVAICNGDLFYRNAASGEFAAFTQVDPGTTDAFSTTMPAVFATLRGNVSGAPMRLYIASGGKLYEWDGSVLTRLDGATSQVGHLAPDASVIENYHLRLFTNSITKPQHLIWSRLGDARVYKAALPVDGGSAMISATHSEDIVALKTLGRSLLIFTHDSITRFSGYSASDVRIDQDTEGVSPDVGAVGPLAIHRVEHTVFFISDRGPYLANEGSVAPIGLKVKPIFDSMNRDELEHCAVGHHHGRNEVWVAYTPNNGSNNTNILIYNTQHNAWYGPFIYSGFGITYFSHYEDSVGDEYLIAGCTDGFIRHMDTGSLDDVLSNGSGGSNISMTCILAPIHFTNPGTIHAIRHMFIQAVIPNPNATVVNTRWADNSSSNSYFVQTTNGLLKNQRIDAASTDQGRRLTISFIDTGSTIASIHGIVIQAHNMLRQPSEI